MFETKFTLLSLFAEIDTLTGRKKLQKTVHLLNQKSKAFPFRFEYHHFGPYSSQLQSEIAALVNEGYVEEIHERGAYTYRITESGLSLKGTLGELQSNPPSFDVMLAKELVQEDAQFLEMVSTYAFLVNSGYPSQEANQKMIELKPHLTHLADEAVQYYNRQIAH